MFAPPTAIYTHGPDLSRLITKFNKIGIYDMFYLSFNHMGLLRLLYIPRRTTLGERCPSQFKFIMMEN
jgi:hypothetical protein